MCNISGKTRSTVLRECCTNAADFRKMVARTSLGGSWREPTPRWWTSCGPRRGIFCAQLSDFEEAMTNNIHVLTGQGQRAEDRAGEMYELIMELISENGRFLNTDWPQP